MPYGHHKVPDPPCEAPTRFVGDQSGWAAGDTFFGDGSGGEDTADPVLRRAAWAVIKLHAQQRPYRLQVAAMGPVLGKRQTVPRAETMTVICLMRQLVEHGTVESSVYYTDCNYVLITFLKGPAKLAAPLNADLWEEFWRLVQQLKCPFVIRRVYKSHVEGWHVAAGLMPLDHVAGNTYADEAAKFEARKWRLHHEVRTKVIDTNNKLWAIQSRLVATTLEDMEAQSAIPYEPHAASCSGK